MSEELFGALPKDPVKVAVGKQFLFLHEPTMIRVKKIVKLAKQYSKENSTLEQAFSWFLAESLDQCAAILLDIPENRQFVGETSVSSYVEENMTPNQAAAFISALATVFDLGDLVSQIKAPLEKLTAQMAKLSQPVAPQA